MSRLVFSRIQVSTDAKGRPLQFAFRGQSYEVMEIIDAWREVGEWWKGEREKDFFRVATVDGGAFEIYHIVQSDPDKDWAMYRIFD